MSRPALVASLMGLVAALAVAAVAVPRLLPQDDPGSPCTAIVELDRALDLASVGNQAVVRLRASQLADALARRAAGDDPAPGDRTIAQRLLVLLEDPGATVADLVDVVEPVADGCGVTLQAATP